MEGGGIERWGARGSENRKKNKPAYSRSYKEGEKNEKTHRLDETQHPSHRLFRRSAHGANPFHPRERPTRVTALLNIYTRRKGNYIHAPKISIPPPPQPNASYTRTSFSGSVLLSRQELFHLLWQQHYTTAEKGERTLNSSPSSRGRRG